MKLKHHHRKLFLPAGIISLSCLLLISTIYLSFLIDSNRPHVIELQSINNKVWDYEYYGISERKSIKYNIFISTNTENLFILENILRDLLGNKDTSTYASIIIPSNGIYADFVRMVDIIKQSKLEFALDSFKNELVVWYEDPIKSTNRELQLWICGTYRPAHSVYQSSPEINYKIFFDNWSFGIIIIAWFSLIVLNLFKLKKLFKFSS